MSGTYHVIRSQSFNGYNFLFMAQEPGLDRGVGKNDPVEVSAARSIPQCSLAPTRPGEKVQRLIDQ